MSEEIKLIDDNKLIYQKEKRLFIWSMTISIVAWITIAVTTFGAALLFIGLAALGFYMMEQLYVAHMKGFGIKVTESQYPDIYNQLKKISKDMNLENIPALYIVQMNGILNAFALNIFSRNFVIITTGMLDACGDDVEILSFIIAHEVAHLTRKHTSRIGFLLPSRIIPWLGSAYSRACEYTCDALGAKYGASSLEKAKQGIAVLATASIVRSRALNMEDYIKQAQDVTNFWPAIVNTNSSHPFTSLRYARIDSFSNQGRELPKSNLIGFLLAPLFSWSTAIGIYILFAVILTSSPVLKKFLDIRNGGQGNVQQQETNKESSNTGKEIIKPTEVYLNKKLGMSINYFSGWKQDNYDEYSVIFSYAYDENNAVSMLIQKLPETTSDEVISQFKIEMSKNKGTISDENNFVFTRQDGTTIIGKQAKFEYSQSEDQGDADVYKRWVVVVPYKKSAYTWIFISTSENFNTYKDDAMAMLNSWMITE